MFDSHEVALVAAGKHVDGYATGELDGFGVGGPVGRGHKNFVARVEQGRERLVDGLLATVRDNHLGGGDDQSAVAQSFGGDRFAHVGQAGGRRVAVVLGVKNGGGCGIHNVCRCGEVWLPGREADDRAAFGLEGFGFAVNFEGCGFGDGCDAAGDAVHWRHSSIVELVPVGREVKCPPLMPYT